MILLYHRVRADDDADPHSLGVTPERFEAQLLALLTIAKPASLDEVTKRRGGQGRFIVTFDDGYADNLYEAAPIARRLGVPFTAFVTSGVLGKRGGFWWDRLTAICERLKEAEPADRPAVVHLVVDRRGEAVPFDTRDPTSLMSTLHRRLRPEPTSVIEGALEGLAAQLGVDAFPADSDRVMTPDEVASLAAEAHVTIGAHTVDHTWLPALTYAEQKRTMVGSKRALEEVIGEPVRHFAYPFGTSEDFGMLSTVAARASGFTTAVTTIEAPVRWMTPRHRLPRYTITNQTSVTELVRLAGNVR
jgi:peptidoglycan/xylan/chitin deacetylase (PgdA/CDA1 family)